MTQAISKCVVYIQYEMKSARTYEPNLIDSQGCMDMLYRS